MYYFDVERQPMIQNMFQKEKSSLKINQSNILIEKYW